MIWLLVLRAIWLLLVILALTACASSKPAVGRDVKITSDRAAVSGCESVGIVRDDDFDDMAKKASKMGGNVVVLIGATPGAQPGWIGPVITQIHAGEVYRCAR